MIGLPEAGRAGIAGESHIWLVLVSGDLDLPALQQAAAGIDLPPVGADEATVDCVVAHAAALLKDAGLTFDRQAINTTAQALLALSGTAWHCPALPWALEALDEPAFKLDVRLRLRPADRTSVHLQPEAVALLLAMGAFDHELQFPVRRLHVPADGSCAAVRLIPLVPAVPMTQTATPDPTRSAGSYIAQQGLQARLEGPLRAIGAQTDEVVVIAFDVDDQSPEDLATGLDRIRAEASVLSVNWTLAGGKKGRPVFGIEVLARPTSAEQAILACLRETSTIGLRWRLEQRVLLARQVASVTTSDGRIGRIKTVVRPGGQETTKAESDDIARVCGDWADRCGWRTELESWGKR